MVILYCPHTSSRLQYMADWLGIHLTGSALPVFSSKVWDSTDYVLNYSDEPIPGTYWITPTGLLQENGIRQLFIRVIAGDLPYFFASHGNHPFDILSAAFYLLSRYEEYLPHQQDRFGRYAHQNSLAFKSGFLKRPLVDEWIIDLKQRLQTFFPGIRLAEPNFRLIPTYDVDMAWRYRGKTFGRQLGGAFKELFKGEWKSLEERRRVANKQEKDPFDVFGDMDKLHMRYDLKPHYFFLLAKKIKGYDRNIPPGYIPFQHLINELSESYDTGIHLSWQAWNDPIIMQQEKAGLEKLIGRAVTGNRMHYIKFALPTTYRQLLVLGITSDYSMGYGSINGFRASSSQPFFWYDIAAENTTDLLLYPFCYMEANSIFEQKDDPATAFIEMMDLYKKVKVIGGAFVCIFHNHLIGRDEQGRKWWNLYNSFLENISDSLK